MTTLFLSDSNYNMKVREMWCPNCKEYSWNDEVDAICPNQECYGQPLITVVYSLIDGSKITGKNELGSTSS